MRKYFIYCSLGLLSLSWLTGCGIIRNLGGEDDNAGTARSGLLQKKCTTCQAKGTLGTVTTVSVGRPTPLPVAKVGDESMEIPGPVPATTPIVPVNRTPATYTLPELPTLPRMLSSSIDVPGSEKIVVMPISDVVPITNQEAVVISTPENFAKAGLSVGAEVPDAKEKTIALRSVDIRYGHGEKFASITGQVQEYRKTLRLRYAAIDENDVYGGVVVLEGSADLSRVTDGKHVRVRGELIPPTDRNGTAHYRVAAVEILD